MNRHGCTILITVSAILFLIAGSVSADEGDSSVQLLSRFCIDCHNAKTHKAEFALHDINPDIASGDDLERWEKILEMVSIGDMPPEDKPQPTKEQRRRLVDWLTKELQEIGRGPVAGTEALPKFGNRIAHDSLFSGEHKGPAYTRSRLWRISPEIYQRFSSKIDMARKFNAPLQTAGGDGIRDYSLLYADEATIKTMLQNCKRAATTLIHGRIKTTRNRSSTTESQQGGRVGTRHQPIANFLAADGLPSDQEMGAILDFAIQLLLERQATQADRKRYIDRFLRPNLDIASREVALTGMLTTIMMSPEFLFRMEVGLGEELPDGRRMLSSRELAYALSFTLFDYVDPTTLKAASAGQLTTKEDVAREFRRMINSRDRAVRGAVGKHLWVTSKGAGITDAKLMEASHPRLLRFFREYFDYVKVREVFKDDTRHDGRHDPHQRIIEADWFVLGILRDDRQVFERLLTDDWYFINPQKSKRPTFTAPPYNIDEDTPWPVSPKDSDRHR